MECLNSVISGSCCVLPGALDLQKDGIGVIGKQQASDQTKYPACNKSAVPGSSGHTDQRGDDVEDGTDDSTEKITPHPVDHLELLVHLHHEDAKEDHGEDHLTDGQSGVTAVVRQGIADDDDETDDYFCSQNETFWGPHVTFQLLQAVGTGAGRGCISHFCTK